MTLLLEFARIRDAPHLSYLSQIPLVLLDLDQMARMVDYLIVSP